MRLIDADTLKAYFFRPYSNEESYSNIDIEKIIDEQITVKSERKGKWIVWKDCEGKTRELTCSECGCQRRTWINPNYCEDCGAKMEAEE